MPQNPISEDEIKKLFSLSQEGLADRGITQTNGKNGLKWAVAWSRDTDEIVEAIFSTLEKVDIRPDCSFGLDRVGWYVRRESFYLSRQVLLENPILLGLGVEIVTPQI